MDIIGKLLEDRKEFLKERIRKNIEINLQSARWKEENEKELLEVEQAIEWIKNGK